jgi:hypothetical protein
MGWRWNLDYVVDPHGNLTSYNYATETNYYSRGGGQNNGNGTLTSYVRAGYPQSVSYGYRLADAISGAKPAAQVLFGTAQRCLTPATTCASYANLNSSTASDWPDVPYDQNCGSSGSCTNYSPTFWSTVRLTSITTEVLEGSSYQKADSYALDQQFPSGAGSDPVMFLDSITHTGQDGTAVSLPPVTFTPSEIDNRVDGLTPAAPPLYRPRLAGINTEAGAQISVVYAAPACSRVNATMPAAADTNTMPCFPVWWTPPGQSPILDWFNKSLITQVQQADQTSTQYPSVSRVTNYQYPATPGAAWHQNDSPVVSSKYRTWDQYRGYATVITTTGAAPDPVTRTKATYMRGMNGDATASGGTKTVSVANSLGESITDDNWLAGQVLETDTFTKQGGIIDAKTINGPWGYTTTADQAMPGGLPDLTAHMVQSARTRTLSLLASGSWRTAQTDTSYNSDGQVTQSDDKGDVSVPSQEVCTTTSYAASSSNPMMRDYPSEVKAVAGPCGTTPTAASTVSDTRTFYDGPGTLSNMGTLGSIPGPGDATGTQVITGYSSGTPVFQAHSAATFDAYGRRQASTDANGNQTSVTYTPATGALPAKAVSTNPMGWQTTTLLDQGRQLPVQVTDPNGRVTSETYDALGRRPGCGCPAGPRAASRRTTPTPTPSTAAPRRRSRPACCGRTAPTPPTSRSTTGCCSCCRSRPPPPTTSTGG